MVLSIALALSLASAAYASSCSCGYVLTKHNNAYFPLSHNLDFSHKAAGPANANTLPGWRIANGFQTGATALLGTTCEARSSNVRFTKGALELVVPGGQHAGGPLSMSCAEIDFGTVVTGGAFTMNAQLSAEEGTCQSMFTYHSSTDGAVSDEQDIEMLGSYLSKTGSNGTPPGIELTNWNPNDPSDSTRSNTIVHFPQNPTTQFHNYTIFWPSGGKPTQYFFNNEKLNSPKEYSSTHPSVVILNNWSNGDSRFTQGPPAKDTVMKIKALQLYYKTEQHSGLPHGCTLAHACRV